MGLSYAAYSLFSHSGADYLTVSQLKSQVESFPDQQLRVEGRIVPGSINCNDKTKVIRFVLTDDRESLAIVYTGVVTDNFKPGAELVVVGNYGTDGVFQVVSLDNRGSFCNACH